MTNESYIEFAEGNSDEYDRFLPGDHAISDLESRLGVKLGDTVQTLLHQRSFVDEQ